MGVTNLVVLTGEDGVVANRNEDVMCFFVFLVAFLGLSFKDGNRRDCETATSSSSSSRFGNLGSDEIQVPAAAFKLVANLLVGQERRLPFSGKGQSVVVWNGIMLCFELVVIVFLIVVYFALLTEILV